MRRSRGDRIFAWAWPSQPIDQLLQAAVHARDDAGRAAWRQWAHSKDLNDVRLNEMRLLAAIAPRLKNLDPTHDERNRIVGIERMLWSRSQMLLRQIQPALESLGQAQIEMMVLKGAARIARDPKALRLRFVNDVDILVRPSEFRRAFDLLDAAGWRSTAMGTAHFQRTLLDQVHGVNLIQGDIADLDVHRSAFHPPHESLEEDSQMWTRSGEGALGQCPTRVPSATDTIVLALAHGGQSGHRTSDWLLDIVDAVAGGAVDWDLLQEIVERRRLAVPAAVTLNYLAEQLECPIPTDVLESIVRRARRSPVSLAAGLLLCRPKDLLPLPLKVARIATKAWRTRTRRVDRVAQPAGVTRRARALWLAATHDIVQPVYQTTIRPDDRQPGCVWRGVVEATLILPTLKRARRIEFELNAGKRHLARVKYRKWTARPGDLAVRFQAIVTLGTDEPELQLEAAPGRGLRHNASSEATERYAPVPFNVVDIRCRRLAA